MQFLIRNIRIAYTTMFGASKTEIRNQNLRIKKTMMNKFFLIILSLLIVTSCANKKAKAQTEKDLDSSYLIQDNVLIKTRDGGTISAMVVQKNGINKPQPVIFQFTIYVRDKGRDIKTLKELADNGYVAVIGYTRGKRFSSNEIWPYEYDAKDTYDVIDWISKQKWSNGSVGMFGGSYNGFTQWSSMKEKSHPALKTIVPYVANRPGMGLPMENNIFINPNYEWSFFIGNNKYFDTIAGNDRQRFRRMQNKWWETGAAYNELDSIDGTPNRLFQKWISHPSFDEYWQNMAPYEYDFTKINIPILSIDGYFNDSQNSGLYYLKEHYKYNPKAEHYLIIGPYSHFGAQRNGQKVINGYEVDADALIDTKKITYQWLDYILKDGKKPEILKDKINYQVMGANEWRSASSIKNMSNASLKLYLTSNKSENYYSLSSEKPKTSNYLSQEVDFSDRQNWNNDYYPDPIIKDEIDTSNGFNFISEPLSEPVIISGSFTGEIIASINKKDFDFGVTLYELKPNGKYFHLSYTIIRASYVKDIEHRNLLTPNSKVKIPLTNTHLVSKKLNKGSRLVVYINVNKNPFSQLNYGTGKEVSSETIDDTKEPLKVKWFNESYVEIPIWKDKK